MKFSYQWLSELVPGLNTEPAELQRLITNKTAECEGIEAVGSDWIIEIDNKSLTHRPDLWGHFGMAREVAAITGRPLKDPVKPELLPHADPAIRVDIADHALCPRYSALVFENVKVGPSPDWLRTRLESIGLNSINNIVDVTNYILAELPQPMHAFDADKLRGPTIFVRAARSGEQLRALNGEAYTLSPADLVIADESGPVALAGVIGGLPTAISESTTRVVLESANFQASSVRLTSARHKLRTDASMRFEKSLDRENTVRGLARAIELFSAVAPGIRVRGGIADNRGPAPHIAPILLPLAFVTRKLGKEISQQRVREILHALGFASTETAPGAGGAGSDNKKNSLSVTVPTWRATKDISLKDDLVEEIGRMIGYETIEATPPRVDCTPPPSNPMRLYLRRVRAQLAAQGFTEVYNYSFVNQNEVSRFQLDINQHIAVRNPIASELTHLRRSLLPGLYKNILSNVRHYPEFRLFEIGKEIHPSAGPDLPKEIVHAAGVLYTTHGNVQDFFELKRVVECVFPGAGLAPAEPRVYEHPFRTAEILWSDPVTTQPAVLGRLFELHPSLLESEGIEGRAFFFDVDLELAQTLASRRVLEYTPLRKYPTSGFDLSVLTALKTPVANIQAELAALAGANLALIDFIRQYDGPPLPAGQKSVSFHLDVGALDHTLSADEVTEIRNRLMNGMRQRGYDFRA